MFQTTYSFAPGCSKATSYPSPVCIAPTGVQPAANWPAVTTLPLSSSSGPVPPPAEVQFEQVPNLSSGSSRCCRNLVGVAGPAAPP